MPRILVVDDSVVDQRVAARLLADYESADVDFAIHGREALERIEQKRPDVVVTDLIMPEMDGLELVAEIHRRYPLVPVILMTSKGSEQIAVTALKEGASSYVPKSALSRELRETVSNVLAVSGQRHSEARLMDCLASSDMTFELQNDSSLIPPLVGHLQETISKLGVCDEADCIRIGIALEEALSNALYHGNLEVGSELRETDYDQYYALVESQRRTQPFKDRRIHVRARLSREKAIFDIRDEGPGFDPSSLPDPTDPANLEKVSGRGVLLMRTFMDNVEFNPEGNQVTMIKVRNYEPVAT